MGRRYAFHVLATLAFYLAHVALWFCLSSRAWQIIVALVTFPPVLDLIMGADQVSNAVDTGCALAARVSWSVTCAVAAKLANVASENLLQVSAQISPGEVAVLAEDIGADVILRFIKVVGLAAATNWLNNKYYKWVLYRFLPADVVDYTDEIGPADLRSRVMRREWRALFGTEAIALLLRQGGEGIHMGLPKRLRGCAGRFTAVYAFCSIDARMGLCVSVILVLLRVWKRGVIVAGDVARLCVRVGTLVIMHWFITWLYDSPAIIGAIEFSELVVNPVTKWIARRLHEWARGRIHLLYSYQGANIDLACGLFAVLCATTWPARLGVLAVTRSPYATFMMLAGISDCHPVHVLVLFCIGYLCANLLHAPPAAPRELQKVVIMDDYCQDKLAVPEQPLSRVPLTGQIRTSVGAIYYVQQYDGRPKYAIQSQN